MPSVACPIRHALWRCLSHLPTIWSLAGFLFLATVSLQADADQIFLQNSRRFERSGKPARRRRRLSARPRKSGNELLPPLPPRMEALMVRVPMARRLRPTLPALYSFLRLATRHLNILRRRLGSPSSSCRTTTITCTPTINRIRLILRRTRASITLVRKPRRGCRAGLMVS
jgi:hypothetical protein